MDKNKTEDYIVSGFILQTEAQLEKLSKEVSELNKKQSKEIKNKVTEYMLKHSTTWFISLTIFIAGMAYVSTTLKTDIVSVKNDLSSDLSTNISLLRSEIVSLRTEMMTLYTGKKFSEKEKQK